MSGPDELPDDDGIVFFHSGLTHMDELELSSAQLMWSLLACAGDNDAIDRALLDWRAGVLPGSEDYIAGRALALLARTMLGRLVELVEECAPDYDVRGRIANAHAEVMALGGSR